MIERKVLEPGIESADTDSIMTEADDGNATRRGKTPDNDEWADGSQEFHVAGTPVQPSMSANRPSRVSRDAVNYQEHGLAPDREKGSVTVQPEPQTTANSPAKGMPVPYTEAVKKVPNRDNLIVAHTTVRFLQHEGTVRQIPFGECGDMQTFFRRASTLLLLNPGLKWSLIVRINEGRWFGIEKGNKMDWEFFCGELRGQGCWTTEAHGKELHAEICVVEVRSLGVHD